MGPICGCVQEEESSNEVVVGQPGKMLKTHDSTHLAQINEASHDESSVGVYSRPNGNKPMDNYKETDNDVIKL